MLRHRILSLEVMRHRQERAERLLTLTRLPPVLRHSATAASGGKQGAAPRNFPGSSGCRHGTRHHSFATVGNVTSQMATRTDESVHHAAGAPLLPEPEVGDDGHLLSEAPAVN